MRMTRRSVRAAQREFALERLRTGANMLRDLWWSACVRSATPEPQRR